MELQRVSVFRMSRLLFLMQLWLLDYQRTFLYFLLPRTIGELNLHHLGLFLIWRLRTCVWFQQHFSRSWKKLNMKGVLTAHIDFHNYRKGSETAHILNLTFFSKLFNSVNTISHVHISSLASRSSQYLVSHYPFNQLINYSVQQSHSIDFMQSSELALVTITDIDTRWSLAPSGRFLL